MTTTIHTASAGYDTVYSGTWVPGGVGRLKRVVGPPPEAESNRRQNKYFKRKKNNHARLTNFEAINQMEGNSVNNCDSFKSVISVRGGHCYYLAWASKTSTLKGWYKKTRVP